ncbi:c-type cytochrome [Pseudemcibacter aquimaris]|uniref:c-type cytochrome n=1 Tax=Pseudemcibacter aquimaris TaxID=2857064 RepID=UPI002012F011|nr:c-type cytochrome [Pseudemcibacter aquimaris]MCC3862236.1 c-type cytochrome [Pseudemcibacter aquimaris]WDU58988.1 c-type cytochrome [Pseudemcibacter aquimaris]
MFAKYKNIIGFTAVATSLTFGAVYATAQEKYGFGTSVSPDEIARYDGDIHIDGTGLPDGSGNVALGRELYEYQCAVCHGEKLEGVRAMGAGSMHEGRRDIKKLPYATSLFDFIRRAMPLTDPGTLSNDEAYGLTAFLLVETGVIDDPDLTLDAESLKAIKMPNRDKFIIDPDSRFTAEDLADK